METVTSNRELLYFSASWCGPCKQMKPLMKQIAEKITVRDIDVEDRSNQDICLSSHIRSIPQFILLENGIEKARLVGAQTDEAMWQLIG